MAKRLVTKFGLETLNVIETDIKKLKEVEGIGDKRIEMIKKAWDDQKVYGRKGDVGSESALPKYDALGGYI